MLFFYKKLLGFSKSLKDIFFSKSKTNTSLLSKNTNSIITNDGSLIFILENDIVVILINIPETSNKTSDEIVNLAENYANFIITTGNDSTYNTIINLLEKKIKEEDNISNKLFLENVLYFAPILKNQLEKEAISSYINDKEPLIRPTNVFRYITK